MISQSQIQHNYQYQLERLYLAKFNARSAKIFYSIKPEGMSDREWAFHPSNPNRLSEEEKEAINILDEIVHKSGKGTFCRQHWIAARNGVSIQTIRLWLKKWRHLGIIETTKIFHYKWVNSYRVTVEFSKFKCPADRVLTPCNEFDHSECLRPEISYTCTSCHRYQGGLSVEQQHKREADTLKSNYEQKIAKLEQQLEQLKKTIEVKKQVREQKSKSKAAVRKNFLSRLQPSEVGVIKTFEAVAGREFDLERDGQAWKKLNQHPTAIAIIGIVQTAINLLAKKQAEEGKDYNLTGVDINNSLAKATIYSLKYCLKQVEAVAGEFKQTFNKLGKELIPSKTIMGYLGTTLAALDAQTATEMISILVGVPVKQLGGKQALKHCLGIFAAKMVSRQVKVGMMEEEDRAEVFNEYLGSLLIQFNLRC